MRGLHHLGGERLEALELRGRHLEQQLVVHLQEHAALAAGARPARCAMRTIAILTRSAAVPWMGALVAMRSPKPRRFGLPLRSSGR